jgi:hypothetical protein
MGLRKVHRMRRFVSVFAALALVVAVTPVSAGSVQPRLPTSVADWATFSDAEQSAALTYEWDILSS